MYRQHQIHRNLTSTEGIAIVQGLLAEDDWSNRSAVGRRVCQHFGFYDARGREQFASCMKVLNQLERQQQIVLPDSRQGVRKSGPRLLGEPVSPAVDVPARVDQVCGLTLELVTTDQARWLWNELMAGEHPLGAVIHCGAQLRYLVHSEHGYLAALGFSAAALRLACRDEWIGWDDELRSQHLHRVVCLSRFLIRLGVACHNLASKVLGLCLRRLADDFRQCYGYGPYLVETFVDRSHTGVSLRASNWRCVGESCGRGRFSRSGTVVSKKSVYVYELQSDWRQELGVWINGIEPRAVGDGLDIDHWSEQEFGAAPLGDVRLSRRLVKSADVQARQPQASFVSAAGGDRAAVLGHYRLMEQPADSEVTADNMLAVHRRRTQQRMLSCDEVLCVQDGTDLNFANHGGCEDLGTIGKNRNADGTLGIHLHSVLVLDGHGVPLGVPHLEYGSNADRGAKSGRWLRGLERCVSMSQQLGQQLRVVSVMDREADFFELYSHSGVGREVDLVVRAKHNRSLGKGQLKLFDWVRGRAAQCDLKITVGRQSARRSSRTQKARDQQSERVVKAELRWCEVSLPAPSRAEFGGFEPVKMRVVHLIESQPPVGVMPLEWLLLTTLPIHSRQQALAVIERYRLRWRIEDWHRILKSGCKVELLAHRTEGRLERAITIHAVIAWRLAAMTLLGRETPELAMELMFSELELACLHDYARHKKLPVPKDVGSAMLIMATLAGYLNRKHDPPPGYQKIWEGYIRLTIMTQMAEVLVDILEEGQVYKKLRPG